MSKTATPEPLMRILHLDSGREMRGGQWQALRLHRGLLAAGHESLLLARAGSPLLDVAARENLPCEALRPLRLGLLSRGFDLVHAHDARSHTLGAAFARATLVVSRRVAFPVGDSRVSRWKYRRPALFIAVSCHVASRLRDAGVDEARIAVVYDGVPVPSEPAQRRRYSGALHARPGKRHGAGDAGRRGRRRERAGINRSGGRPAPRPGPDLPDALRRPRLRHPARHGLRCHCRCQ